MSTATIPYLALIPYAAIALGLTATLALFLSLKWELQRTTRRERKRVDEMFIRLQEAEGKEPERAETVYVPVPMRPGINVNRRVHIQRLLRKGQDPARIAATLGIPRAEVDLLVRVHRLNQARDRTVEQPLPATAGE